MTHEQGGKPFSLTVFLPFYNEEENIRPAVAAALGVLQSMNNLSDYEVIVVDDGSSDRTREIAETLAKENSKVRVVVHPKNLGYGSALKSGISNARFEYVFFTDGDLQFDIGELAKLARFIPEYDVVIGYRSPRKDPAMRILNAKVWNILNRFAFGLKIRDIDCAFKLFKTKLVKDMPLISNGAMLSAELLIRLKKDGVQIKQVPVTHLPRTRGSATGAKPSVIFRALKEFWLLYNKSGLGNHAYLQAAKFIIVGAANTIVDIIVYYLLTRHAPYFSNHLDMTRVLSFLSGTICSFILNRAWTFKKKGRVGAYEFLKFYLTVGMSLIIGVVTMQFFISAFHLFDLVALGLSIIFTFIWNFSLSKLWVFKGREVVADELFPL